jgi:hypothetical protein
MQVIIRAPRACSHQTLPLGSGVHISFLVGILLLAATAWGQNWPGAEEQLAEKIVAVTGSRTMVVEVSNQSSLTTARAEDIRRGLWTQLAARGVRLVAAEQAAAAVRVALSENLQNYLWVAEIRFVASDAANQSAAAAVSVVMVSLPLPAMTAVEPEAGLMVLHKASLWSQQERILDAAVIKTSSDRDRKQPYRDSQAEQILVLDARGVTSYRLQDGRWQAEQLLAIAHSRPWPRDLRGRLVLRRDHLFDAYLPGIFCRSTSTSPLAMECREGDGAWPIGTDLLYVNSSSVNAPFEASRNYFSGAILPDAGNQNTAKQTMTVPFYSAAPFPRSQATSWLIAAVDGQVHMLDGATDQVMPSLNWGSDIAAVRSGCGTGWQVLTTRSGEGSSDAIRAFEVSGGQWGAVSPALEFAGSVTALWSGGSESGESNNETGAIAVVRNAETGGYEAFSLTVSCIR